MFFHRLFHRNGKSSLPAPVCTQHGWGKAPSQKRRSRPQRSLAKNQAKKLDICFKFAYKRVIILRRIVILFLKLHVRDVLIMALTDKFEETGAGEQPRGSFMSRLGATRFFSAAALGLAVALIAVPANDALAKSEQLAAVPQQNKPLNLRVPGGDARGMLLNDARLAAAVATKKQLALVYYGSDPQHIEAAQGAVEDLRAEGWPVGLIVADGNSGYDVFVDQERWVPLGDGLSPVSLPANKDYIKGAIKDGYSRYQEVRMKVQTSSLERTR